MSINYQELVPEKALGKEISRHIFQTYRAKTGLPHEIEQNIEHIKRLNPEYEYHLPDLSGEDRAASRDRPALLHL